MCRIGGGDLLLQRRWYQDVAVHRETLESLRQCEIRPFARAGDMLEQGETSSPASLKPFRHGPGPR
jgi:hypothetical protein